MREGKPYVLITGVSGGIGSALVHAFHDAGYLVIATDIVPPADQKGIEHFFQINLESLTDNEKEANEFYYRVHQVLDQGGLKALVNNAALQIIKPIDELTVDDFKRTLNVNCAAPFFLIQNFLKALDSSNGSVINISSIHSKLTKSNFTTYASSKAALSGLTRALAVELGGRVRINAVAPAAIATKMLYTGFEKNIEKFNLLSKMHPVGRIGYPHEVASLVLFLASEDAGFINGSIFEIDGGIGSRLYDPF